MRLALMGSAVLAVIAASVTPGAAAWEGPWCAHRSLGMGFYDNKCDIPSYEHCRAEIFATPGAYCTQNPRYAGPPVRPAKRKAKRKQL